jgi:histidinol-phosphatase (PHP family)
VGLPADGHVHSEWSYDAPRGSMEETCARAVELGLPAVAFTEHADHTRWTVDDGELAAFEHLQLLVDDGAVNPPPLNVDRYLESVDRCRDLFPSLRVISGVELGEPHWHRSAADALVTAGRLDRVLGSLHCLPIGGDRFSEVASLFRTRDAGDVLREYLAEIPRLIDGFARFAVLAHIDYAVRDWPADARPFDPSEFEDDFRHALRALASADRALEVNTRGPMRPEIVGWWREEGGDAVSFGSDAHDPVGLAHGFAEAAAMVEAHGFRPGRHPYDFWRR